MTDQEYEDMALEIERLVGAFVDDHRATKNLSAVARRNMAYCAGHAAMSALTSDDLGIVIENGD